MSQPEMSRECLIAALFLAACGGTPNTGEELATAVEQPGAEATEETPIEEPEYPGVEIPFEKFVLDNGLTVIVHTDRKAPVVAVNVWYHVGSKDEQPGKTGFAHLFEHLMFQGSENFQGEFFDPLQKAGATDMNGTTNSDRTNYFETVPTPALDLALWMESDRMGHFEGAISQELLDEQRGVVQNEKRQGLNRPYGKVWEMIPAATYPAGHPYSWSVIGSMEDLDAASLEDVKKWFAEYYGAANAVVALAGDITPEVAREKMEKYFGDIPAGPAPPKAGPWVAKLTETKELTMYDRVPQERVYRVYNVPPYGAVETEHLRLAGSVLADGKNARLHRRLVYEDQLATDVGFYLAEREIGSQLYIIANARPGVPLEKVEVALEEELERFKAEGPTADELIRAKMRHFSSQVKGLERVGGFGGKSDLLAKHEVFFDDPGAFQRIDAAFREAKPADVQAAAKAWLDDGVFIVRVLPEPQRSVSSASVDRSSVPSPGEAPNLDLPELQRTKLANGIEVVLAERHDVPVVHVSALFDVGFAYDHDKKLGTTTFAMNLLDEGTEELGSLELAAELERLGASIGTSSTLTDTRVTLQALKPTLGESLDLFADVVKTPAFQAEELERQRKRRLASIEQEKVSPVQNALRVLGPVLFGEEHAFGMPLTGSGTIESVQSIQRDDLVAFHRAALHPSHATLLVVGDTTLDEIKPLLEERFGDWSVDAAPAEVPKGTAAGSDEVRVFLIDKPRAEQSFVLAGHLVGPRNGDEQILLDTVNDVIGGSFMARLNMNLREDKHWSYGARSFIFENPVLQAFASYAQVQTDKTAESMAEMQREFVELGTTRPPSAEELQRIKDQRTRTLPGRNETTGRVLSNIVEIVRYGLPDDYWDTFVQRVNGLALDEVREKAKATIEPSRMTWVVVGDLSQIEEKVRALNLGEVTIIDQEGRPVPGQASAASP